MNGKGEGVLLYCLEYYYLFLQYLRHKKHLIYMKIYTQKEAKQNGKLSNGKKSPFPSFRKIAFSSFFFCVWDIQRSLICMDINLDLVKGCSCLPSILMTVYPYLSKWDTF